MKRAERAMGKLCLLILLLLQRVTRVVFWRLSSLLYRTNPVTAPSTRPFGQGADVEEFLLSLAPADAAARVYLQKHLDRLVNTTLFVPKPLVSGRALELGCYMQIGPALTTFRGYKEIRGAYLGPSGETVQKSATANGGVVLRCNIDLFDAEWGPFPVPGQPFRACPGLRDYRTPVERPHAHAV